MSVLDQLACSLGRRDEVPNQELARTLAASSDVQGIAALVEGLSHPDAAIRSDCIKTLYEVGFLQPELIAPHAGAFLALLRSRENRLVWGGMLALSVIGRLAAADLFPRWEKIQEAMESGSVITRDGAVAALAGIASARPDYAAAILPHLLAHLRSCRPKDVPQHGEKVLPALTPAHAAAFIHVLEKRLEDLQGAQLKRIQKVIVQAKRLQEVQ